jgi:hypothetical protein
MVALAGRPCSSWRGTLRAQFREESASFGSPCPFSTSSSTPVLVHPHPLSTRRTRPSPSHAVSCGPQSSVSRSSATSPEVHTAVAHTCPDPGPSTASLAPAMLCETPGTTGPGCLNLSESIRNSVRGRTRSSLLVCANGLLARPYDTYSSSLPPCHGECVGNDVCVADRLAWRQLHRARRRGGHRSDSFWSRASERKPPPCSQTHGLARTSTRSSGYPCRGIRPC